MVVGSITTWGSQGKYFHFLMMRPKVIDPPSSSLTYIYTCTLADIIVTSCYFNISLCLSCMLYNARYSFLMYLIYQFLMPL